MRTEIIDPEHRPDLFFLPDGDGNPTLEWEEDITVASGKSVKKKAVGGKIERRHLKPDGVDIYKDEVLIASWKIIPQYYQNGWQTLNKDLDNFVDVVDGALVGSGTQGGFFYDINISLDGKWTIHVVAPGFTVRFIWEITIYDPADLEFSLQDYPGVYNSNVPEELEAGTYQVIFEPDGSVDGMTVDPYLRISEPSNWFDVYCDGFVLRVYYASASYFTSLFEHDLVTIIGRINSQFTDGTTYNAIDAASIAEIIENTSERVVIRYLVDYGHANISEGEYIITCYKDRIAFKVKMTLTDTVTLVNQPLNQRLIELFMTGLTPTLVHEDSGSETTETANTDCTGDDYVGMLETLSDQVLILLDSEYSGTAQVLSYIRSPNYVYHGFTNGTLTAGVVEMSAMIIIDAAEREGSAKLYDSTDRLAMGDQYNDLEI